MGKLYSEIGEKQRSFIEKQKLFFVSTAPLSGKGHVNLSPKGLDTFRVMGPRQVAYLDLIGSGVETIAHLRENGRITIMFCAFDGPPNILRLYGRGKIIEPEDTEWEYWAEQFPHFEGRRAVIDIEVTRVADSCGYSVPLYEFQKDRRQLTDWCERKGPEAVEAFVKKENKASLDGLPGLNSLQE